MTFELTIKIVTLVLIALFFIIRSRYTKHFKLEKRIIIRSVIVTILILLYAFSFLDFANFYLNPHIRIFLGFPLIFIGYFLFFSAHIKLRKNWSPVLAKRLSKSKKLITFGPYKYIRHPIYAASFMIIIGFFFLISNWLLTGVPFILLLIIYTIKIPKEEKFLIKTFGKKYKDYIKKTGRLFPKV